VCACVLANKFDLIWFEVFVCYCFITKHCRGNRRTSSRIRATVSQPAAHNSYRPVLLTKATKMCAFVELSIDCCDSVHGWECRILSTKILIMSLHAFSRKALRLYWDDMQPLSHSFRSHVRAVSGSSVCLLWINCPTFVLYIINGSFVSQCKYIWARKNPTIVLKSQ